MSKVKIPLRNYNEEKMFRINKSYIIPAALLLMIFFNVTASAQYDYKWLSVGSLHSYYTSIGAEIEEGRVKVQQDGLQWPAIYRYQDMSAAKGLWVGAKNFTDAAGFWPYRVVHVGPRVTGGGEFFPQKMKLYSKFEAPVVNVDNAASFQKNVEIDSIDPNMPYDRLIVNTVNNLLGLTLERKIYQFSNPYFDNFIVHEHTYTNTGNTDDDDEIELNAELKDVVLYYNYRWAVNRETRYVVGNGSGWGMNTMNDVRGDGLYPDPAGENFRTSFAWHGYWPSRVVAYNNIGAPIWIPDATGFVAKDDTVGRLGAPQFIGVLTLHADQSAVNPVDDPNQPFVTRHEGSDIPLYSGNDAFNLGMMTGEYKLMTREDNPAERRTRHAYLVHPAAIGKDFKEFANQTNPPEIGTPGGFSSTVTYGPYNIPFGESVKIIFVEGAAGISREAAIDMGRKYKQGQVNDVQKNEFVLTGKDSLMQTWRRVTASFQSNWNLSQAPKPPSEFSVNSNPGRIALAWSVFEDDPNVTGFEIYRAQSRFDSTYYLVHSAGRNERAFNDTTPIRGVDYYYYIVSVGQEVPGDPALNIPPHRLKSSRYYTQTFDPANLQRALESTSRMSDIRVVPNPYSLSSDFKFGQIGSNQQNQLSFWGVPKNCTIKIFTELGELIETLEKNDLSSDMKWLSLTTSKQVIVSGVYIAVITDNETGEKFITKFVVTR
jgi:hypothetical protein